MDKLLFASFFSLLFFVSCSGLEHSEQQKIRRANCQKERIYRKDKDRTYEIAPLQPRNREPYPWEDGAQGSIAKVTKEALRCKGRASHPPVAKSSDPQDRLYDCDGIISHSLPVRAGREFVFPVLLNLLNYVQQKEGRRVKITCGHRCPTHNSYCDQSLFNQSSKHMIGAEVDFYVETMEDQPEKIVSLLMEYYTSSESMKNLKEYTTFLRLEPHLTNVSIPPWYNKEIMIKIYQKNEGRDFDNNHPFPYISLQVRFDADMGEKVSYSSEKAQGCFLRY